MLKRFFMQRISNQIELINTGILHLFYAIIIKILMTPMTSEAVCNISCDSVTTPASPINLGSYDPYNYTSIAQPFNLAITCSGTTPPADCAVANTVSYTYRFIGNATTSNPRSLTSGSGSVSYNFCTSSNCSIIYDSQIAISNSYSFVPNVGRTDNYTVYIVVPVQPLSVWGLYSGSVNTQLQY